MTTVQAATWGDPAMFEPLTADEKNILWAHLVSGWYKQATLYPGLSEPWQETGELLDDLLQARRASWQAGREPEAGP